ncbi:MAG: metal-dependent hydrolase [Psychrobium sp.]
MSNGKTHIAVGAVTGLALALVDNRKHKLIHNPIIAPSLGAAFGKLPDIIEPALHPHHRQFFHSKLVFAAIGYGLYKTYNWEAQSGFEKIIRGILLIAGCSYLSHLVCDSTTPRGLPLIGKI